MEAEEVTCGSCSGSGVYDDEGSPPCGACLGTGTVLEEPWEDPSEWTVNAAPITREDVAAAVAAERARCLAAVEVVVGEIVKTEGTTPDEVEGWVGACREVRRQIEGEGSTQGVDCGPGVALVAEAIERAEGDGGERG